MSTIDIALREDLQKALKQPICPDISLPKPGNVKIELPFGGSIKGITDITKGIPTDCSLAFSLMLQLGPILANLECFISMLRLIKPLIDVIKGLPFPPVEAIKEFGEAVPPVLECFAKIFGLGIPLFIKDLLCLIIKLLRCMVQQMKSMLALLEDIVPKITAAEKDNNIEALAALNCSKENIMCSGAAAMQAFEPIVLILELAGPVMEIAGMEPLEIPELIPAEDAEAAKQVITILEQFVDTLQLVADGLGGCD